MFLQAVHAHISVHTKLYLLHLQQLVSHVLQPHRVRAIISLGANTTFEGTGIKLSSIFFEPNNVRSGLIGFGSKEFF